MLAVATEQATEVSCVILPLRRKQLVLPTACVAEVLLWREPAPVEGAPAWWTGTVDWHGAVVPVLDLEALDAPALPASETGAVRGRCLAVVNRTTGDAACPFYAVVVHGIPRLVLVAQMDLTAESEAGCEGELLNVRIGTEALVIPDLAELERRAGRLHAARG
jgi:chemosensory pili system protein ChpC